MYDTWWIRLRTYNGLPFRYRRMANGDREIEHGSYPFRDTVISEVFQEILRHFHSLTVPLGASYDDLPPRSFGAWLTERLPGRNLALYVGSVLVHEGYAEWEITERGASLRFLT